MTQYTTTEQTAKLIELGFERPFRNEYLHIVEEYGYAVNKERNFSIGDLIEMLPQTIKLYYDLSIFSTSQGWWVLYGMIGDGDMWSIEHEVYRDDLIDALYDMILKLKAEGVI
jgi:hypothetical protein